MVSYIWGGNTGVATPEDLANRRRWAQAMIQSGTERTPEDPWEGLASIARAVSGSYANYKAEQEETKQRGAAGDRFNALFQPKDTAPMPAATGGNTAKVTPVSYSPDEQTGAPGMSGIAKAWLGAIAGPESAGKYDVLYGGTKFADMSDHPRAKMPITSGPNKGNVTTAAGKYQFLAPTWDDQKKKLGLTDFSPGSQDAAAWNLSKETYKAKTGRDLEADLASADDAGIQQIAGIMSGTWTSLPGGIEQGINGQGFVDSFRKNQGGSAPATASQPVRLAQAGGPSLPELLRAYSDPWTSPEQKSVLQMYIEREMQTADPLRKQQLEKGQLEIDALRNPKSEYGFTTLPDGTVVRTDKTKGTAEPVMKGEQKPTDDIAEYQYYVAQAKAAGQAPLPFDEYMRSMKKAGATMINTATGEPTDNELRKKLQGKEGERWDTYQAAAVSASGLTQQLDVVDELSKMAPQGGIQGRLAETFRGFSTAGDAFASIVTRIAPSFREPGSGSTSDVEYQGFLNGLPRLLTTPGGNQIISRTLREMASIKMERGAIVDAYADGKISAPEARKQMAELNKRSIMTPELQAVINATTEKPETGAPDADGWTTYPNGVRVREKK